MIFITIINEFEVIIKAFDSSNLLSLCVIIM